MSTFTGTTSEPPRTPHGSPTTAADLRSQPVSPAAHAPGPVSTGWDIPDLPAGASLTGTSPAALATAPEAPGRHNATLQGFAPSPEVLQAIQEQRAKILAQQAGHTQPMAAPEIAAEAYIPSGSAPAESYMAMHVVSQNVATDPAIVIPPHTQHGSISTPPPDVPVNSTMPALSPLPMQPAVVLMASQPSAISQAPLPSVSMPHAVAAAPPSTPHEAVVVSPSMAMAAVSPPKPPTASLLEGPAFQAAAAAVVKTATTAGDTDKHRAAGSNKTLWIVFAIIAIGMIGATIAIVATR